MPDPSAREDIENHLGLWLHIQDHRDLLHFGLCTAISRLARRICELGGDHERRRYGGILLDAEEERQRLYSNLQRQFGSQCLCHADHVLTEMKRWEILLEEHGYQLHTAFTILRELEEALVPAVHPL
jgi:hypothetical protein